MTILVPSPTSVEESPGPLSGPSRGYEGDCLRDRRRSRRTTNVASRLTSTLVTTGNHFGGRRLPR